MNAKRRKRLGEVHEHLSIAVSTLEDVVDEEQDCLDNTPENFQDSESYAERESALEDMADTLDDLRAAMSTVAEWTKVT